MESLETGQTPAGPVCLNTTQSALSSLTREAGADGQLGEASDQ